MKTPLASRALLWSGILAALALFPETASADSLAELTEPFRSALDEGSFGMALGLIFLAGLATSLTPCVYPMIAITVSVFGARQAKSRTEAALLSTSYVLGMAAMFTPLGLVSGLSGAAMGSVQTNPWIMIPLCALFLAMAASMFGAFDLDLPSSLKNRVAQVGGSGLKGAFALGFVGGIVAAPCTGPVLTVLLTWVGTSGDAGFGALSLFVYSLGLGVLFWVVGTFAVSLPKSGRWVEWIKSVFGVAMLVMALYFLSRFLPSPWPATREPLVLYGAVAALVLGLGIGAIHLSFKGGSTAQRARKGLGVLLATIGLLGIIAHSEALAPGARIAWRQDIETAKAEAEARSRPMLVDFGADWCGACQELEHEALSDPRVVAEARRFVTLRVDLSADSETPEKWALLRSYGQPGLPLVVVHDAEGQEVARVTGLVTADEFLDHLRAAR